MKILTDLNRSVLVSPYSVIAFAKETAIIGKVVSIQNPSLDFCGNIWFHLTLAGGSVIPGSFMKLLTLILKSL